ncbi:MAG TPA: hypothetical protein VLG10_09445, partial [Methylomirabilota bacterium]|nr:hypothetical protein [Methylomirabilota bacterium]
MKPGRTALLILLALGVLLAGPGATAPPALAQSSRPPLRIGVVREQPPTDPQFQAFVASLREQGWVEG